MINMAWRQKQRHSYKWHHHNPQQWKEQLEQSPPNQRKVSAVTMKKAMCVPTFLFSVSKPLCWSVPLKTQIISCSKEHNTLYFTCMQTSTAWRMFKECGRSSDWSKYNTILCYAKVTSFQLHSQLIKQVSKEPYTGTSIKTSAIKNI